MDMKIPDKQILNQFPEEQKDDLLLIWDKARRREPVAGDVPGKDVQAEWKRLQKRVGLSRPTLHIHPARSRGSAIRTYAFIAAMAAVLLGGFLMWYLFVPVSIEAPRGSYITYQWGDGVRVELNSGSVITWNRSFTNGHRNIRLHGEAYFEVPTGEKPFVVETQTARVEVLGTRFNVRSWSGDPIGRTILTLVDGQVRLASLLEPESHVLMPPGHTSQIDLNSRAPREPEPIDTEQALAWRNHGFYFSAIPMSEVAAELERRYDSEIIIDNEQLGSRELTIYLPQPGDLETIIETICFVTDCRYEEMNGQVHLY
jgi:transmembrane sensor